MLFPEKFGIQLAKDLVAGPLDVDLEVLEDARSDPFALPEQAEQDVLRSHVAVVERLGFLAGEGEDLLHPRSVGNVPDHLGLGTVADLLFDLHPDGLEIEIHLLEDVHGDALTQLDQAEQQVLRAYVIVIESIGLLTCEGEDLLSSGGKIIHHQDPGFEVYHRTSARSGRLSSYE